MVDVAEIVPRISKALKNLDTHELREISHTCSADSVLTQNKDEIILAVISYAFNKIFSKVHYRDKLESLINNSIKKLNNHDFNGVLDEIGKFDKQHSYFEGSLVGKARIKIASRLYSSGLSIAQSAELVETPVSDLLDYAGVTKESIETKTLTAKERLAIAREVFK